MKTRFAVLFGFAWLVNAALAETLSVPGRASPWLAGMTNGATARRGDSALDESPVPVTATAIRGGAVYVFSASGSANHGSPLPFFPPDGEELISHYLGAENGIADLTAPFVSLIGVFLGTNQPEQSRAPRPLDFRAPADRDHLVLAPALKQPFFIGNGVTSSGAVQQVIAPTGAARLFLGVMDEYQWSDNEGAFTVQITMAASAPPMRLPLHPSLNPARGDIVAIPAQAVPMPTAVSPTSPNPTPTTLRTAASPELQIFTAIELVWPSEANLLYQVQWTPSLDPPQWVNVGPVLAGTGTTVSAFDSTRVHPQGFYHIQIVP